MTELALSSKATTAWPVPAYGMGGAAQAQYGHATFSANPTDGDTVPLFWLPANCTVLFAVFWLSDVDTGTEQWDMDIGWEANGVESADADGFGNFGVWASAAVTNVKPETGTMRFLGGVTLTGASGGFPHFSAPTRVVATVNDNATASFQAGTLRYVFFYKMD